MKAIMGKKIKGGRVLDIKNLRFGKQKNIYGNNKISIVHRIPMRV